MIITLTSDQISNAMSLLGVAGNPANGFIVEPAEDEPGFWLLTVPESYQAAFAGLDLTDARPGLLAYAAKLRWQTEVGGIVVAGVPVATDDRSKLMVTGARVAAAADPNWVTVWHGADGGSYPIDASAIIAVSDAVQAHVNATFSAFAAVKSAIEAGSVTTTAEIDAAFIP